MHPRPGESDAPVIIAGERKSCVGARPSGDRLGDDGVVRRPGSLLPGAPWLRTRAYLVLGLVFGAWWFGLLTTMILSGIAAQFLPIGVLFLCGAVLLLRPIGRFERFLVRALLHQDIPVPRQLRYQRSAGSWWSGPVNLTRRSVAAFHDGYSWRVLLWTLIRFGIGPLGFVLAVVETMLPLLPVVVPLVLLAGAVTGVPAVGRGDLYWLLALPLGPVLFVPIRRLTEALADLQRQVAVQVLGPGRRETEAAALARAEAAEEQVRIDQELHDSLGHMLSMIVVQAGAGAHVFDQDPEFARSALRTIEERGRVALGELDRIIARFRDGPGDEGAAGFRENGDLQGEPDPGTRTAAPETPDLDQLVADARDAGMDVTARIRAGALPPAVGAGIYRIVQEALTNAAKHAPGRTVAVEVAADTAAVAVAVTNPLSGNGSGHGSGHGSGNGSGGDSGNGSGSDSGNGSGNDSGAICSGGGGSVDTRRVGRGLTSIQERASQLGGEVALGVTGQEFTIRIVLPLAQTLPARAGARCELTPGCTCLGCGIRRTVLR